MPIGRNWMISQEFLYLPFDLFHQHYRFRCRLPDRQLPPHRFGKFTGSIQYRLPPLGNSQDKPCARSRVAANRRDLGSLAFLIYDAFTNNEAGVPVYLQPPPIAKPAVPSHMNRRYFGLRDDVFCISVFTGDRIFSFHASESRRDRESFSPGFPSSARCGAYPSNTKHQTWVNAA